MLSVAVVSGAGPARSARKVPSPSALQEIKQRAVDFSNSQKANKIQELENGAKDRPWNSLDSGRLSASLPGANKSEWNAAEFSSAKVHKITAYESLRFVRTRQNLNSTEHAVRCGKGA